MDRGKLMTAIPGNAPKVLFLYDLVVSTVRFVIMEQSAPRNFFLIYAAIAIIAI